MPPPSRRLSEPFAAYRRAVLPQPDRELTAVGPGTPGGEYLRRFWHPVAHADGLGDLPLALRILGEDLVLFPRWQRRRRPAGAPLQPPRHLARVRPHRGARPPLLLPRLAVRHRRQGARDPGRARRQSLCRPPLSGRLQGARAGRPRVRLYGAARARAATADVRPLRPAGRADGPRRGRRPRQHQALQLAADHGQRGRPGARALPACAPQRHPVPRRRGARGHRAAGARRARLVRDPDRHPVPRVAPGRRFGLGALDGVCLPQHRPGVHLARAAAALSDRRGRAVVPAVAAPLAGAGRRHPHHRVRVHLLPRGGGEPVRLQPDSPAPARTTATVPTRSVSATPATTTPR